MFDHRRKRREKLMQALFACTFNAENLAQCLAEKAEDSIIRSLLENLESIDARIQVAAPERPLNQINKVDLAIIRLIVHESDTKATPAKVLLNEAIELAKLFSAENSPGFVNGVLAKIILEEDEEKKQKS